jgi:hypothetical protein
VPTFQRDLISFQYPNDWTVEESLSDPVGDSEDEGWSITIQSRETAILIIAFRPDADEITQLAEETLSVLKEEYPELDAEDRVETLAGRMTIGHDIDLIALDATVACQTRCLESPGGPMLLMLQYSERDSDDTQQAAQAILKSLTILED